MFTNYGRFWGVRIPTENGPIYRIGKEGAEKKPFTQITGDEVTHFISIMTDLRLERESDVLYSPDNRPEPQNFLFEFEKALLDERFGHQYREMSDDNMKISIDDLAELVGMNYGTLHQWLDKYIPTRHEEKPENRRQGYDLYPATAKQVKILHDLRSDYDVSMQSINERNRNKIFHQIIGVDLQLRVPVDE